MLWRTLKTAVGDHPDQVGRRAHGRVDADPAAQRLWSIEGPVVPLGAELGRSTEKVLSQSEGQGALQQLILRAPQAMLSSLEFSKDHSICSS